jgi:glycosyltransferase involved in cell wall biosynthesis
MIYQPISYNNRGWIKKLQQVHDRFDPDCIVAVNFYPCLWATRLDTHKPIWMDIYGDMITILQASGYRSGSNRGLPTTIYFLRQVLSKGDIFSACSLPQQHMLVGELAMVGRLNFRTFGYEFVHTILPGAAPLNVVRQHSRRILSELSIKDEDFVVLWAGGYNTWTDVDTLFTGLQDAMARNPQVHFVSLGANTYQAPDNVYTQFLRSIEQSNCRARFHMLGWRSWQEIPQFYIESDIGINIDAMHYETIYGTRTRLLEMLAAGLPVITTLGSELSYMMREAGVALTFPIGNSEMLATHILELSFDREKCQAFSARADQYARADMSFSTTTQTLRKWVRSPVLALDHEEIRVSKYLKEVENQGRAVLRQVLWRMAGLEK